MAVKVAYWEIHYEMFDLKHKPYLRGVCVRTYKRKGYAQRIAKYLFDNQKRFHWWLVGRSADHDAVAVFDTEP